MPDLAVYTTRKNVLAFHLHEKQHWTPLTFHVLRKKKEKKTIYTGLE